MRRFWILLCLVTLLVVALAVPAAAAEGHSHCVCGGTLEGKEGHTCQDITFTEVTTAADFTELFTGSSTEPVNICLGADFTISSAITNAGQTVTLCLGGHTLTLKGKLSTTTEGVFNITTCGGGSITAGTTSVSQMIYALQAHINLYNGTINASKLSGSAYGGAVYVKSSDEKGNPTASFTMYGGNIVGAKKASRGCAVYMQSGQFFMHGGIITGGEAQYGGAVGINFGKMVMDGGIITGGNASTFGGGVNIHHAATSFTLSGDAKIYGNVCADAPNDVNIGIDVNSKKSYLTLGQWKGNGAAGVLNLSTTDTTIGSKAVIFAEGVTDPYAMKAYFVLSGGQLAMFDDTGFTRQNAADHIHCLCGGNGGADPDHSCLDVTFEKATALAKLSADKNYYLGSAVELVEEVATAGHTLNLCLNGRTVTMKENGRITANGTTGLLNIADCGEGGAIVAAEGCRGSILYTWNGNLNLYGGTIDGRACAEESYGTIRVGVAEDEVSIFGGNLYGGQNAKYGGAIGMTVAAKIYIYGGTVHGGTTTNGGSIYASKGEVTVAGGTITGGKAANGGNIYIGDATLTISGGIVENGNATVNGGNIVLFEDSGTKPQLFVTGGTITGGTAAGVKAGEGGGNIASTASKGAPEYPKVDVSGGTITGGSATGTVNDNGTTAGGDGGNINMNRGWLTISGGTITGGSVTGNGCGVQIGYNCKNFTLSGNALIYGNNGRDLHLSTGAADQIVLDNWAGNGAKGPMAITSAVGENAVIVKPAEGTTLTAEDVNKFTEGYEYLRLVLKDGEIVLEYYHAHCLCSGTLAGTEGHSCEAVTFTRVNADQFKALFGESKLLSQSANVVLSESVTLDGEYKLNGYTLNLCLNGKTVTMSGSARLTANGTTGVLNITDCGTGGTIKAAAGCRESFLYTYNGNLNLYGGKVDASAIAQSTANGGKSGGAVTTYMANDLFTMYGGTIVGGTLYRGGAVYVFKGLFKMLGGQIYGGTAGVGGNVATDYGAFEMLGGKIYGGTVVLGEKIGQGANVMMGYNTSTSMKLSGDAMIYGGTGAEDIYCNQKDAKLRYLKLDSWQGNGKNGKLVVHRSDAEGKVFAQFEGDVEPAAVYWFAPKDTSLSVQLNESGQLHFVKPAAGQGVKVMDKDDTVFVATAQQAITLAQGAERTVVLGSTVGAENDPVQLTADGNLHLDLNSNTLYGTLAMTKGTLYLLDSASADYNLDQDASGNYIYGKLVGAVNGTVEDSFTTQNQNGYKGNHRYIVLQDADGTYHAHRIYLAVKGVVLYPQGPHLQYRTEFKCDQVVAKDAKYGVQISGIPYDATEKKTSTKLYSTAVAGAGVSNSRIAGLTDILVNEDAEVRNYLATMDYTACGYISVNGQEFTSASYTTTLKKVVEGVDKMWGQGAEGVTETIKPALVEMYETYAAIMEGWDLPNIKAAAAKKQ